MRKDNFLVKKQREREERKKRSLLEKLMNTPQIYQRSPNESKRSKKTNSRQNSIMKGNTLNNRRSRITSKPQSKNSDSICTDEEE